jgi:hypothetical protein
MKPLALLLTVAMTAGTAPPVIRDLEGRLRHPFAPGARASVLIFLTSDCPISNAYAPEIQSVCAAYASKGVDCLLLYEDAGIEPAAARAHLAAYRYSGIAAAIDGDRAIAEASRASVTPEAVVIDRPGAIRYRGRIDNLYVDVGRRRTAATVHDLRDAIDAVLAGRPVAQPRTEAFGCYITPPRGRSEKSK